MSANKYHVDNYNPKTNFCNHFPEPITVQTTHQGIELKGHFVFISPSDFTVELDTPFNGITFGLHTPYFAMFEANRNILNGTLTERGFERGEAGLVSAFEKAIDLFQNKNILYNRILKTEKQIEKFENELTNIKSMFYSERKQLKALLKSGEITQKEYMAFISKENSKIEKQESTIQIMKRDVFSCIPDFIISYGKENEALEFVKNYYNSAH